MRILLTNDDGIYAPGLAALKRSVERFGEATIVAPESERSAAAHSITLDRPLRVTEVYVGDEFLGFSVDGSPADCVKIGVRQIMDEPPDLVLSGINPGANVGINVLYSGTVAAALEGAILNITSMSISLAERMKPDFETAASLACEIIDGIIEKDHPRGSLFNINIPARPPREIAGIAVTRQSTVSYDDGFDLRVDPRGGRYYWMTGEIAHKSIPPDTDMAMLERGFITITPLQYDLTDNASLGEASRWVFGFRPPGAGQGGEK